MSGAGTADAQLSLDLGLHCINYRLIRSPRRTIAIHIGSAGVEARAPLSAGLADIESFMRRKERWILSHLAQSREARPFAWQPGSHLPLLGEPVILQAATHHQGIALEDGALLIGRPGRRRYENEREEWRPRVLAWIREQALAHFEQRAATLAPHLKVDAPALQLSNAAGRWGSCSVHGAAARVRLHWKLYLLRPGLIDYVVAHELAHLRELNHSPRFWALVAGLCPDHAALRRELNRRGRALPLL